MKNFKKVISVVMALAMIISSFTAVSAAKFADVAETAAYAEAVEVLKALGVVNGVEQENGTFNFEPEKSVTRAEAVTMIVGALNLADDAKASAGTSSFGDVNTQAAWAAGFVNVGVAQGFISGYDATTFGPLDNVTYAQLCVMLTQITGYGEYAKAYGGWPTGYTTMAANAGINKGVAVASDAALTKGQVAMMIWNALQAPLLGVSEYAIDGNKYKPHDGSKNGLEYKSLFQEKFDGYVGKVTIDKTPVVLNSDEMIADITVVESDYWLPEAEEKEETDYYTTTVYLADDLDVNSYLKHTGKGVFVLNEDEEEVMVYFGATAKSVSKEFAADTYYAQEDLVNEKQFSTVYPKIRFGSSFYEFDTTIDLYVNGVEYDNYFVADTRVPADGVVTANQAKLDDVLKNAQGTIKILKSNSKNYNAIFVDFYQVAKVTAVDVDTEETTITLQQSANLFANATEVEEITITKEAVEEGKVAVTVTRNGEEATLESLKNGDVVAYALPFSAITSKKVEDPKKLDILATNDKISGVVTAIDSDDDIYTIGGADYTHVPGASVSTITVKKSLDATLDPFGRIYEVKVNADTLNLAIALRRGTDNDTIKLLLADGTTKTYTINEKIQGAFEAAFCTGANDINATTVAVRDRVVAYEVSPKDGTIARIGKATPANVDDLVVTPLTEVEYKSRSSVLGTSKILDTTPIINCAENDLFANNEAKYSAVEKADLLDGTTYDALVYSINRTVALTVITKIGQAFGEESRFAVAVSTPKKALTEDGETVWSVDALYDGEVQEIKFVIENDGTSAADDVVTGKPFYFLTDADGLVDEIFSPAAGDAAWEAMIDTDEWTYTLWNPNHDTMQFVTGVVVEVAADYMAFADKKFIEDNGTLNTNIDLEESYAYDNADKNNGIVIFGIADDCVAYTYDEGMATRVEADKYDVTTAASIKASNFSAFDYGNSIPDDGIYSGDLKSKANVATAMVVDGQIVAIFAIEK